MKCSLGISDFLEEISSLSHSGVFLYFFALIAEEGFLISSCYSLELCIQMFISFPFSFAFHDFKGTGCDDLGSEEEVQGWVLGSQLGLKESVEQSENKKPASYLYTIPEAELIITKAPRPLRPETVLYDKMVASSHMWLWSI